MGASRRYGAVSLLVLGAYAAAVWAPSGPDAAAVEPFPLGALPGTAGPVAKFVALLLGLTLGWGIPGLSLAALVDPGLRGLALLPRALGLGVGYVFLTGLGHALLVGHAPRRGALLVLLALPCAAATIGRRRPAATAAPRNVAGALRHDRAVLAGLAAAAVLTALFWPKLRLEGMNGDGTEAYELARSLDSHPFPRWDLERDDGTGRFGTPVAVPLFTGAFVVSAHMAVLGRGELALRLALFVTPLVVLVATAAALVGRRARVVWPCLSAATAVYVLWNAYWVGYEPAFTDLAEPAGTDTATMALWLAGFRELMAGGLVLGIVFLLLASGMTYSAPALSVLALASWWLVDRRRAGRALLLGTASAVVSLGLLLAAGAASGDLPDWIRQVRVGYWEDLVDAGRRVPAPPLVWRIVLMTGVLPLVIPWRWSRLTPAHRVLALTGAGYLVLVLAGSYKNLHYLSPLPWLLLPPALSVVSTGQAAAAASVLATVFALSWPSSTAVHRETIALGEVSCVEGLDYESAALAADAVYRAFDRPGRGVRFEIGKHTFVRYALDLGDVDRCLIRLSASPRPGWPMVVDQAGRLSTRDVDAYARWRLSRPPIPASLLFPRRHPPPLAVDPAHWTGRHALAVEPGRSLVVASAEWPEGEGAPLGQTVRLLVPVTDDGPLRVRIGVTAPEGAQVRLSMTDQPAAQVVLGPGSSVLELGLADGLPRWSLAELQETSGRPATLEWLEAGGGHQPATGAVPDRVP